MNQDLKLFGKHGDCNLQTKEERDQLACYVHSGQKPASLIVWLCVSVCGISSLNTWKGISNAERYIQMLGQYVLQFRQQALRI